MTIDRRAARTLIIADGEVLLIQGQDPARPEAGQWWLVPGGGIDGDESPAAAAVREVFEETGLRVTEEELGPVIATRVAEFDFDGRHYRQAECFFAVQVERFTLRSDAWNSIEQQALLDHRWWTLDELGSTPERLYPPGLETLLRAVLAGPIDPPLRLS